MVDVLTSSGRAVQFTRDHMEAAMSMWEWVIENEGKPESPWYAAGDDIGMGQLRSNVLDAAIACETDYQEAVAVEGYDDCFDWAFVPAWMDKHADWIIGGAYS